MNWWALGEETVQFPQKIINSTGEEYALRRPSKYSANDVHNKLLTLEGAL